MMRFSRTRGVLPIDSALSLNTFDMDFSLGGCRVAPAVGADQPLVAVGTRPAAGSGRRFGRWMPESLQRCPQAGGGHGQAVSARDDCWQRKDVKARKAYGAAARGVKCYGPGVSDDIVIPAFRAVPRTGVIFVTAEAHRRGYRSADPAWANLGQGMPETG